MMLLSAVPESVHRAVCVLQVIDDDMQSQDQMKQQKLLLKSQADDVDADINEIRKRLTTQSKDVTAVQKTITALEIKLEQKKADRHSLLKSCKVKKLSLLFLRIKPLDEDSPQNTLINQTHE